MSSLYVFTYNLVVYIVCSGVRAKWLLFPVLARMEFDTKERSKFFGCARERACGIGSGPRKGCSVLRPCTPHSSRKDLHRQRMLVAGQEPRADESVDEAVKSLQRRGLHPYHICTALTGARPAVIRWPGRIYHGLFTFDVMHHLYLNCIGYLQEALLDLLEPKKKNELNKRLRTFTTFRNPRDGSATPKVTSLTNTGYLTAEQKVHHLFVWSHAIGSKATIFPENLRSDVLKSICNLQILCFTVRGKLPFTAAEHKYIWSHHGKQFLLSLSSLVEWKRKTKIQAAEKYNLDKPPAKRRRVPYWKVATKHPDQSSDTAQSSDQSSPPFFLRSHKIVPHSFVHFPEQVVMGGTHTFHNTSSVESCHKINVQLAGQRARVFKDVNASSKNMLKYGLDVRLLKKIVRETIGMYSHTIWACVFIICVHIRFGRVSSLYVFTNDLGVCLHCMCSHTIWAYVFTVCVHIRFGVCLHCMCSHMTSVCFDLLYHDQPARIC